MFTGLIQAVGEVAATTHEPGGGLRLQVRARDWDHQPQPGESISVSGVCLTLAAPAAGGVLAFDVVAETLAKTTLGGLREGLAVNLERSLSVGDLLGGHMVQGHVDGVGAVERVQTGADYRVAVRPPPELMQFIVPKGSVAVDGVSLTVAQVGPGAGWFDVALIPTTLEKTTLGRLTHGDRVNLETDIIARTVVHTLRHFMGGAGGR